MLPGYSVSGTQGGAVYLPVRWRGRDATEVDFLYKEGVCRAKGRADVIHAPDIVKYNHQGNFFCIFELVYGETGEFLVFSFPHAFICSLLVHNLVA